MTLIVAAGNEDQFIQVSDRRVTRANGTVGNDESNKSIVLTCADARLAVGFTGLAGCGQFKTQEWLLSTLNECAPPDRSATNIVNRLALRASEQFQQLLLPQREKRLTIMLTGYLYGADPPLGVAAIISNFQNMVTKAPADSDAWDHFECFRWQEPRPHPGPFSMIHAVGTLPPVDAEEWRKLTELVKTRRPARAIVGKLVEVFRRAAESPHGGSAIGRQLMSVILPRDLGCGGQSAYHSDVVKQETYFPDLVYVVSDKLHLNVSVLSIAATIPTNASALSAPKLRAGQPCWCKSGKKFKHCHGRKKRKSIPITIRVRPDP